MHPWHRARLESRLPGEGRGAAKGKHRDDLPRYAGACKTAVFTVREQVHSFYFPSLFSPLSSSFPSFFFLTAGLIAGQSDERPIRRDSAIASRGNDNNRAHALDERRRTSRRELVGLDECTLPRSIVGNALCAAHT